MIEQAGIALFGITAVFLSQDHRLAWRRYACLFGFASQPFWFWSSYMAGQWGIFALAFVYTYCWWRGFRQHWQFNGWRIMVR